MTNFENELILNIQFGGLGDNLFLSPIPRLFKEKYPNGKVYLSSHSKFRSSQIKEIVWDMNPYVDGISSKSGIIPQYGLGPLKLNILSQLAHSLNVETDINLEPEIYYKPELIEAFSDKTLIDLNYTSFVGSFSKTRILNLLKNEPKITLINPPKWSSGLGVSITTESLKHYIDLIYSCQKFICFTSGGATLAASIKKPSICLFGYGQNNIFHHSSIHQYMNVKKEDFLLNFLNSYYLRVRNKIRIHLSE